MSLFNPNCTCGRSAKEAYDLGHPFSCGVYYGGVPRPADFDFTELRTEYGSAASSIEAIPLGALVEIPSAGGLRLFVVSKTRGGSGPSLCILYGLGIDRDQAPLLAGYTSADLVRKDWAKRFGRETK
jgi:hypothetical protein